MADEDKLKVQSLPPPPTDEIDEEWGSSDAASASPPKAGGGAGAKAEGAKASSKPSDQPKKRAARPDPDEDDEDDEDDDDDDDDDEDTDDEDTDDEDTDDEDDDDEDDEPRRTKGKQAAGSAFDDLIPDWMPWATLGGLLLFGFLGGIGVLGLDCNLKRTEATAPEAPAASAKPAATSTTAARPTPARSARVPTAEDGEMVAASHLLVAYQGALRAAPTTTRTKDEAKKRATEAQKKAKKGGDFEKLVAEYSDEPGAKERGGRLGKFTRGRMVKEFADAAFAMKVNEISDVVETKFGFHVIKRTE
jgi:hypothetical protein